ncbi:uncharacterized protein LOC114522180 [Dendronephthya gigantea]|uniref:uncharacterized protein LOC114522180 n=1 Tax=Dendronephthya gigantea TaxID=151771 RepID=UPI00106AB029|nr:uncharacterized protein LOC114522180 [Dendronephthya gigantea]
MDDASLQKLSVSPGKLSPKFKKDILEYSVVVGSTVKELKVSPLTSDNNACYSISGSNGGKTVPLQEGTVTIITVEVTAEDGTIKSYVINATRLSSNDASLSGITLSAGTLSPPFNPSCTEYTSTIPYHLSSIQVKPVAPDNGIGVVVRDNSDGKPLELKYGETSIYIDVTSPNQATSKSYHLLIQRTKIPWHISTVDISKIYQYSCPVCLAVLHCPRSIAKTNPKHVFCKSCIDELTRTTKRNPLDKRSLTGDWLVNEPSMEIELALLEVHCGFYRYGCSSQLKLCDLGCHMKQCEFRLCFIEKSEELTVNKLLEEKLKNLCISCPECNMNVRSAEVENHKVNMCCAKLGKETTLPKVPLRQWEKRLQQETSEKSVDAMVKNGEEQEGLYFQSLQMFGQSRHCDSSSSPMKYLKTASEVYATAIKLSPKDAKLHFKLGQILEEMHFVEDCFGFKQEEEAETPAIDFNQQSRDSSKEDDIQAICEQRGFGRNPPLALQLKAIDQEYHHLLESQQSDRCEYVQKLYAWKSKQATQDGKVAQLASDEEGSFGKAYLKYSDAVSFASDNYLYHLHVGRFLLLQGKHEEAVKRLRISVGLKPVNAEARFYLGLALLLQGSASREYEAVQYVHEGLEHFLYKLTEEAESPSDALLNQLQSSTLLSITNVQCLNGFLTLGKVLARTATKLSGHFMKPDEIFKLVASLAIRTLCWIAHKGELYHQIERTLLESHSCLLHWMVEMKSKNEAGIQDSVVRTHCDHLCSLLNVLSLPKDNSLLQLQEKTCQQGVILQPQSSRALYLLGGAQLSRHDNEDNNNNNNSTALEDAEKSFRASLEVEGKPKGGKQIPGYIQEQVWWKERQSPKVKTNEAASTSSKTASTMKGNQRISPTKGITTSKGKATTPTRGQTKPTSKPAPAKTSAPAKATNARAARTSVSKQSAPAARPSPGKAPCRSCSHSKTDISPKQPPPTTNPTPPSPSIPQEPIGPPNPKSYHPRLGLARVLSRSGSDPDAARKFYEECITMAPDLHDAYIELGEILVKSDPLGAVEVYSKYPFPDPLTYDDAYLHGEIARLLIKHEKYEDPKLGPSMIALGKVMGFSVLEKYVDILDSKLKYSKLLMQIYAQVNGKSIDDPDLQQFFKFKCWN